MMNMLTNNTDINENKNNYNDDNTKDKLKSLKDDSHLSD